MSIHKMFKMNPNKLYTLTGVHTEYKKHATFICESQFVNKVKMKLIKFPNKNDDIKQPKKNEICKKSVYTNEIYHGNLRLNEPYHCSLCFINIDGKSSRGKSMM